MQPSTPQAGSDGLRQIVTLVAILGAFGINVYSNLAPPNGQTIGDISNTLFTGVQIIPANYAFAIWGVIYLGLMAFGIYQLLPNQRTNDILRRIGYLLVIASIAQGIWVFLFLARQFWLSVIAMLGILLSLIGAYWILHSHPRSRSKSDRWFIQIPISIYLGWISVATIVNIALALYASNWNGGGIPSPVWTAIMLVIAAAIALRLLLTQRDLAFAWVMVWAFVAIAVRQANIMLIAIVATGLAIIIAIANIITQLKRNPEASQS